MIVHLDLGSSYWNDPWVVWSLIVVHLWCPRRSSQSDPRSSLMIKIISYISGGLFRLEEDVPSQGPTPWWNFSFRFHLSWRQSCGCEWVGVEGPLMWDRLGRFHWTTSSIWVCDRGYLWGPSWFIGYQLHRWSRIRNSWSTSCSVICCSWISPWIDWGLSTTSLGGWHPPYHRRRLSVESGFHHRSFERPKKINITLLLLWGDSWTSTWDQENDHLGT